MVHDAISKWLVESYSLVQVLFVRSVFAMLPIAVFIRHDGGVRRLRITDSVQYSVEVCSASCHSAVFLPYCLSCHDLACSQSSWPDHWW